MLRAHMTGAIDITKEVHPLIEAQILQNIELDMILSINSLYPVVNDGNVHYLTNNWITDVERCILPWMSDRSSNTPEVNKQTIEADIELLKQINNWE